VLYAVAFIFAFVADGRTIIPKLIFVIMSLSIPVVAVWKIKFLTRRVSNWEIVKNPGKNRKAIYGGVGGGLAIVISNIFFDGLSQVTISIMLSICAFLLIVAATLFACTRFYQLHLLKKYCPDLIDYKPGSF